ncbi:MAG: AI-2E family transporter [Sphingobacteriia bacterium]|nr:AI-2E family transporter [Sphingobacteriia bacterium]NCC40135.1 AI-2E family transporter [Gammaproteobacteria bacterium]
MKIVANWFRRHFSDPQIVVLALLLLILFVVVVTMGNMLLPALASIVIAYLLEGLVGRLERLGWPRLASVILVYLVFLAFVVLVLLGVMPLVSRQVTDLVQQLPSMISAATTVLLDLPDHYPELLTEAQVRALIDVIRAETLQFGQRILSWSLASVLGIITVIVYLVLIPVLVFFFMKDKALILNWFRRYLPRHRGIAHHIWTDVDRQISNYVRGKVWEILIIWLVSFAVFSAFGLNYAMLLSLLVGLSVIIPYVGATLVTLPVLLVGWFQWGSAPIFIWLAVAYFVIQVLDGNVLVPLLFSEVVNLHPVAIIVAILVFGGIWGFWGIFFAIPLATLVQAVLTAWPILPDDLDPLEP